LSIFDGFISIIGFVGLFAASTTDQHSHLSLLLDYAFIVHTRLNVPQPVMGNCNFCN